MKTIVLNERDPGVRGALEFADGWYRVLSGAIKPGDLYLDIHDT